MRMLISIILLLCFSFLSAYIAKQRGRDPVAWFMIGFLLGIFAPLLLLLLKPLPENPEIKEPEEIEFEKIESPKPLEEIAKPNQDKEWFYLDPERQHQGPLPLQSLKQLWKEGKLTQKTFVWSEGMSEWKRVEDLPSFMENLVR